MKFKKEILFLAGILILAFILRFWRLGQVPASPDWDEAALGYNAWSIMQTGKDEYGKTLPLILRSFDDYKPAIYVYLAMLPIKVFGLNTFAVRFSAALLGALAVLLVYFLVEELFKNQKIAFVGSFLLAISPWHLQFSRIAFESNIGLFFNLLIALLFLKGLKKPWFLLFSAFFAGLNLYVYQAEKIFTPLLVLFLFLIWRPELFRLPKKWLASAIMVGFITAMPFFYLAATTPEIFLRAKGTSFAADQTSFLAKSAERLIRNYQNNDRLGLILDNRRISYFLAFINNYFSHFDFNWLFLTGDEARHHAPGMGLLYLWELPFLLWGIYCLIFGKFEPKTKWLVFGWFLLAPIPASFSSGAPHAVRTLRMLPMIQVFTALGLVAFCHWLRARPAAKLCGVAGCMFFIFNFTYYLNQYFVQQNYFNSASWQYGYQEAIEKIKEIEPNYQKIIVSNEPHLDQSYIFFLFYLQYDPWQYQEEGGTISGGFAESHRGFDKYTFRPIKWSEENKNPEILYVGRPTDFPDGVKVIKTINFLDGQPAIKIIEGQ